MSTTTTARAVLGAETRLMLREPGALFWIIVFPPALLGILGLIPDFRTPSEDLGGLRTIDLYLPTALILTAIMASLMTMPAVISTYREKLVLRRYATTPARAGDLLFAQGVLHAGAVLIGSGLALLVGYVAYDARIAALGPAALVYVLAVAANLACGALIAGLAPSAKTASVIGTAVFFPSMFTAGVWYPISALPGWAESIVGLTPNGAAVLGLEQAVAGDWPDPVHLIVLVAWTMLAGAVAARYFRWE
ncbi:ABC transporter permease [Aeromicrobium sp. YIM 150415]|uniref:ABC transporter permease n=1 Tax=Aeromicrobium sp. YIM 150415 TaxID=2803912 RepID=UPI001966C370|nr:ABC transporter permease [Aeromicrobium sp. YIM 150415]MBM9463932.1 ABC transporter permease [Aeromicrobium sp. YIM 150415]